MNFQQLNYILALDKFQNFHRAAIACKVSPCILNNGIKQLEDEYQITIFDRSRIPIIPTLKGIDLLRKAKEIMIQREEFIRIAKRRDDKISGTINLAITELLAPYLSPSLIASMQQKYPDLSLNILELSDSRIENLLIDDNIDAAIMISPAIRQDYYEYKLYKEELVLYTTNEVTTIFNKQLIFDANILRESLIHEDLKAILTKKIRGVWVEEEMHSPNLRYSKGNLETIRNIINYNKGSMLLPKIAVPHLSIEERKQIYSFFGSPLDLDISIVATKSFEKNGVIKQLMEETLAAAFKRNTCLN